MQSYEITMYSIYIDAVEGEVDYSSLDGAYKSPCNCGSLNGPSTGHLDFDYGDEFFMVVI